MKILYFSEAARIMQSSEEHYILNKPLKLDAFIDELQVKHPLLAPIFDSILVAVNCEYVDPSRWSLTELSQEMEIAFIPPVSGG